MNKSRIAFTIEELNSSTPFSQSLFEGLVVALDSPPFEGYKDIQIYPSHDTLVVVHALDIENTLTALPKKKRKDGKTVVFIRREGKEPMRFPIPMIEALRKELKETPPEVNPPQLFVKVENIKDLPWPENVLQVTEKAVTYFSSLRETTIICKRKHFEKAYPQDLLHFLQEREVKPEDTGLDKSRVFDSPMLTLRGDVEISIPSHIPDRGKTIEIFNVHHEGNPEDPIIGNRYIDLAHAHAMTDIPPPLYLLLAEIEKQREEDFKKYLQEDPDFVGDHEDVFGGWIKVYLDPTTNRAPDLKEGFFLPPDATSEWISYVLCDNDAGGHVHVVHKDHYKRLFPTKE